MTFMSLQQAWVEARKTTGRIRRRGWEPMPGLSSLASGNWSHIDPGPIEHFIPITGYQHGSESPFVWVPTWLDLTACDWEVVA